MKSIHPTDVSAIRNELNRYKKERKFDINQFNQVTRLAWLGKVTLQPLDPANPEATAYLFYSDFPGSASTVFWPTSLS